MASVGERLLKPKPPTEAELKRGLKAVSKAFGTAASIVREPDGTTRIVPCSHPTNAKREQTVEFKL